MVSYKEKPKTSTQAICHVQKTKKDLPAVPLGSSAPVPVGYEVSSPEPPFSHMRPEAGPKHFVAFLPSPHMPFSYVVLPPAVYSGSEQIPKPAPTPHDADTTPLQKLLDTASHAWAALVLADAPHLNIQRKRYGIGEPFLLRNWSHFFVLTIMLEMYYRSISGMCPLVLNLKWTASQWQRHWA